VVRCVECEGRMDLIFRVGGDAIGWGLYDHLYFPLGLERSRINMRVHTYYRSKEKGYRDIKTSAM
jgi:hypothetical protein